MKTALVALIVVVAAAGCRESESKPAGSGSAMRGPGIPGPVRCIASCDLSTNKGVNAALVALGEKPVSESEHVCIDRGIGNKVARLGDFAYDRGCRWNRVIIKCCLQPVGDDPTMLGALGWNKLSTDERIKLAPEYLGFFHGYRALTSATPAFGADGHPAFTAPTTVAQKDGSIIHTGWFESTDGSGMTAPTKRLLDQNAYTIGADGKVSTNHLAAFTTKFP